MTDVAGLNQTDVTPEPKSESAALISIIQRAASDPTVDIEKMERLFQMHERMVAKQAKTAYLAAFAQLQSELPAAIKRGTGHNSKAYARYEDLIETLRPHFSEHGFSISHRVNTAGNQIVVTGVLGHSGGHSEETSVTLPPDASGNKAAVHAVASSISYGKRYVTLTLTGIATEGEDDDAKRAITGATITEAEAEKLAETLADDDVDIPAFCRYFKIQKFGDLPAAKYSSALRMIEERKKKATGASA